MFHSLKISNYILIDEIEIQFAEGLNVITGETGAGKSILMGALALISGQRAELNVLKDKEKKCLVEAEIKSNLNELKQFLAENEIEFETITTIRREILPNGKSRAFINDTPVILKVLEQCGAILFDIHSQHQNDLIKDEHFRLKIVDAAAQNSSILAEYRSNFEAYSAVVTKLERLKKIQKKSLQDSDALQYRIDLLAAVKLIPGEQEELEKEGDVLRNAEEIKRILSLSAEILSQNEESVVPLLYRTEQELNKISKVYPLAQSAAQRIHSALVDLKDLFSDLDREAENMEFDPLRLEFIDQRLKLFMDLQRRFQVENNEALLELYNDWHAELQNIGRVDLDIEIAQKELISSLERLKKSAEQLTKSRVSVFEQIALQIAAGIRQLGMPKARFELQIRDTEPYTDNGKDYVRFLFSANPGIETEDIQKIASGGERSRLMLTIKQMMSVNSNLSTLVLDEIDTGVSGEVAYRMGTMMQQMSMSRQLMVITHLPQIAARGQVHFKVEKFETAEGKTQTKVAKLNHEQRLTEIASLLSGENITAAALSNARELLLSS